MNEWWLLLGFILMGIVAARLVFGPLHCSVSRMAMASPVLIALLGLAYWKWGAWFELHEYAVKQQSQKKIQAMLKTVKSPQALIEQLKSKLSHDPESAQGWFLLGRLYASQNQWKSASAAFLKAYQFKPDDEAIVLNYAQSLWQLNQNQLNDSIRLLLNQVLRKNESQPDALAMLAMDAYMNHDDAQAINLWQRILKIAPPDSEEAQAIRKAIAKAQSRLSSRTAFKNAFP